LIDFEDGINLGLIEEEYALEYLVKLVQKNIIMDNYNRLTTKKARISYLRALAINTLISETVSIFIANEEALLRGEFHCALLEKSTYKAQIEDIIRISVEKVYRSQQVMEKEIAGYQIIESLLHTFTTTMERQKQGESGHYDRLIMESYLNEFDFEGKTTYQNLIDICSFVASLTDGNALRIYHKLKGEDF